MEENEIRRKSTRTVPVVIESHENAAKKTKLMVPYNYSAAHLVNILRSRFHLLPHHPIHLFLKSKQSPVLMSKSIGYLHRKHRDEKGLLRFIHAEQASFGFRGNIRAIRFRQKWIENQRQNLGTVGIPSHSSVPPPYFPLDPPTTNFGAPLDLLAVLNDPIMNLDDNDEYYESMANAFIFDSTNTPSNMPDSWPPATMPSVLINSSQPPLSESVSNSISSALADWALSSSLSDPWLPSVGMNSSQTSATGHSIEEDINAFHLELQQASQSILESMNMDSAPPASSFSGNNQSLNLSSNLQEPSQPPLYESDSDFYDSDKDVDMED